ncbi:hypothetical protein [Gracilinema caldarium]|uniref:Uncharacterized protein n=1 Tax=Gracilinema caldarium (strain ATCC 51460 / DSM 7334 / H1) TaxID=744872 RepID=F8F2P6_GRAC1|nr:hypothetical protein [Gracilinema caldarium]AEJ19440.1 hypothetical protein Spica_1294 [Gracilinema caldarium DSM 7334]
MGLLQRAASTSINSKWDPMADALVERMLRLGPSSNRVYMVLSLLKTYVPFQGAFVFKQQQDNFTSLEIIGFDIPAFTIKASDILSYLPEKENSWFSADFITSLPFLQTVIVSSAQGYLIRKSSVETIFIVFIEEPQKKIMIDDLSYILSRIHGIFATSWDPVEWINNIFTELLKPGATLGIGIFEKPEKPEEIEKILCHYGRSHILDESRLIIILESTVDFELFFHRIQNSFNIKLLDAFETADSLAAVERIL